MARMIRTAPVLAGALSAALAAGAASAEPELIVTVLGSGAPVIDLDRYEQSTLVEAGGHKLLFDAGRGTVLRLHEAGVAPAEIGDVFFTHYHSDHLVGFPDFWLMSWLPGGGGRQAPLDVIGPQGVSRFAEGLKAAFADDISIRIADQQLPPEGVAMEVTEFSDDGVVWQEDGLTVTAFTVDHGEEIRPAVGYRIDYEGLSAVISGDTRKSQAVVDAATGADLLIHEVAAASPELLDAPPIKLILAHHTTPQEAGEVFAAARPKMVAYAHLTLLRRPGTTPVTAEDLLEMTRETYDGPLVVADDLTRFVITPDGVTQSSVARH